VIIILAERGDASTGVARCAEMTTITPQVFQIGVEM
jgi:hypothetical protein